ncbi:hypothetical protein ACA350_00810 [Orientia tsutsugamushi]
MVYTTTQLRVKTLYIGLADVVITILKYLKQDTNSEWIFPSPIEVIANTGQIPAIHYAWNKIRKRAGIQDEQYMILEERLPLG